MAIELTILGCGSATPTLNRNPTSQHLRIQSTDILIDCGEGTQMQCLKSKIKINKIRAVFISHLHGDHYLGLPGLISSMHLMGRQNLLTVYGPAPLEKIINMQLEVSQTRLKYPLEFVVINHEEGELLAEFPEFSVHSFPLKHRIPCAGFIFRENPRPRRLSESAVKDYSIPMTHFKRIKLGEDYVDDNGSVISNNLLTSDPLPSVSYAYCSDTAPDPSVTRALKNVDHLYHEATFLEELAERAFETFHSTALQAAKTAVNANVKHLLIGHFSSRYGDSLPLQHEAATIFPGVIAVEDGMKFILE